MKRARSIDTTNLNSFALEKRARCCDPFSTELVTTEQIQTSAQRSQLHTDVTPLARSGDDFGKIPVGTTKMLKKPASSLLFGVRRLDAAFGFDLASSITKRRQDAALQGDARYYGVNS